MVFFNCNSCGEALKKNQVEKHYQFKCRSCNVLSCVDCQKEFWGDAYKEHTKCISEEEKYSGKGWKPKDNANKGEKKQEAWIEHVTNAIANCPPGKPKLRDLLRNIQDYPNIPRKKAKFENFVRNSMRVRESYLITEAWDVISAQMNKPQTEESTAPDTAKPAQPAPTEDLTKNGTNTGETEEATKQLSKRERKEERRKKQHKAEKKERTTSEDDGAKKHKKSKKRRRDDESDDDDDETEEILEPTKKKKKKLGELNGAAQEENGQDSGKKAKKQKKKKHREEDEEEDDSPENLSPEPQPAVPPPSDSFQWETAILAVLEKADDNEISLKKLKKKVLSEFHACGGDGKTYTEQKLLARLTRHVLRNPRVRVCKERVKLLT